MYTYVCHCGHVFELPVYSKKKKLRCPKCNSGNLKRKYKPPNIIFKGEGFYKTDNK